uniref:Uncharacterized protein n=1 Tax=Arundo donax TaxID=35708 RepID=A0A0A9G3R4_ARUDO
MENSLVLSSLAFLKDMNADSAPGFAGNCHCIVGQPEPNKTGIAHKSNAG